MKRHATATVMTVVLWVVGVSIAAGDTFVWRNAVAPDQNWHGMTGGPTNWIDPGNNDQIHEQLPESGGTFRINDGIVSVSDRPVQIDALEATGRLFVDTNLTLDGPSQIANLGLRGTGMLVAQSNLSLTGEVFSSGDVSLAGHGTARVTGAATTVRVDGGTLRLNVLPNPGFDGGVVLADGVSVEARDGVAQNDGLLRWESGLVMGGLLARTVDGRVESVTGGVRNAGQIRIEATDAQRALAGVLDSVGTVSQFGDLTINDGAIVQRGGHAWSFFGGSIVGTGSDAVFVSDNGILLKNTGSGDTTISIPFQAVGSPSSAVDFGDRIILAEDSGNLAFTAGGEFRHVQILAVSESALMFGAEEGNQATYTIADQATIESRASGFFFRATFAVDGGATLEIAEDAMLQVRMPGGRNAAFQLNPDARLVAKGSVENYETFNWFGGAIETSGSGVFQNVGSTIIWENASLSGLFRNSDNPAPTLRDTSVTQGADLAVEGLVEIGADTEWEVRAINFTESIAITAQGEGGEIAVAEGGTFRASGFSGALEVPVETRMDNRGSVIVGDDPFFRVGLTLSGGVEQVSGDALVGGTWEIEYGTLNIPGATIRRIGAEQGSVTTLSLLEDAEFPQLSLIEIAQTGVLHLGEAVLETPAGLSNRGSIVLSDRNANLSVNGGFQQLGDLELTLGVLRVLGDAEFRGESQIDGQVEVIGGDVLMTGSLTSVDGQLNLVPMAGSTSRIVLDEGATLTGSGTINESGVRDTVQLLNRNGHLNVGNSPSQMTVNASYVQEQGGAMEVELGGLVRGDEFDQLFINGTAALAGTLQVTLLPDLFVPDGSTFDVLLADSITGEFDELGIPRKGDQPAFDVAIVDLVGGRQAVRLTTLVDLFPFGDFDESGGRSVADIDLLTAEVAAGTNAELFDLTGDGRVDKRDIGEFLILVDSFPGDADLDGEVQFSDFTRLAANFLQTGVWSQGDFDGSGLVDFLDFVLLSNNFGKAATQATAAVPEPSALALIGLAAIPFACRVRRRLYER